MRTRCLRGLGSRSVSTLQLLGRYTRNGLASSDIVQHERPGTDGRAGTDPDAGNDASANSDQRVVPDDDGSGEVDAGSDMHEVADHTVMVHGGRGVDDRPTTDSHIGAQ